MKKWLALSFSVLAVGLPAAGCGGDDDDDEGGGGGAATEQTETGEATAPAEEGGGETVEVDMKDIEYVPKDATVQVGGKVVWTNSDQVAHTVTKEKGPGEEFDSGNIEAGETFEQSFDTAGKIDYVCTIHPNQKGTLTVR